MNQIRSYIICLNNNYKILTNIRDKISFHEKENISSNINSFNYTSIHKIKTWRYKKQVYHFVYINEDIEEINTRIINFEKVC